MGRIINHTMNPAPNPDIDPNVVNAILPEYDWAFWAARNRGPRAIPPWVEQQRVSMLEPTAAERVERESALLPTLHAVLQRERCKFRRRFHQRTVKKYGPLVEAYGDDFIDDIFRECQEGAQRVMRETNDRNAARQYLTKALKENMTRYIRRDYLGSREEEKALAPVRARRQAAELQQAVTRARIVALEVAAAARARMAEDNGDSTPEYETKIQHPNEDSTPEYE
jgi:hypothetical protein